MCFSLYLGIGCAGRVSQGIGTQPAFAVLHFGQVKNLSFRDFFFDAVVISNDHPRYVKPVLGLPNAFIILFGYWVLRGGGFSRDWYTTCFCIFSPWAAQKSKFFKYIFLIP